MKVQHREEIGCERGVALRTDSCSVLHSYVRENEICHLLPPIHLFIQVLHQTRAYFICQRANIHTKCTSTVTNETHRKWNSYGLWTWSHIDQSFNINSTAKGIRERASAGKTWMKTTILRKCFDSIRCCKLCFNIHWAFHFAHIYYIFIRVTRMPEPPR